MIRRSSAGIVSTARSLVEPFAVLGAPGSHRGHAPIDPQASPGVTRATPSDSGAAASETFVTPGETPAARRVSLAMSREPLSLPRDSTIPSTCTRQTQSGSLGLPSDSLGTPSDSQVSICDVLALPIVSLVTSKEAARCAWRVASYTERHARSAETNARCGEKVARSSDRRARCDDRVVWLTERLSWCTEQLAEMFSACRSL